MAAAAGVLAISEPGPDGGWARSPDRERFQKETFSRTDHSVLQLRVFHAFRSPGLCFERWCHSVPTLVAVAHWVPGTPLLRACVFRQGQGRLVAATPGALRAAPPARQRRGAAGSGTGQLPAYCFLYSLRLPPPSPVSSCPPFPSLPFCSVTFLPFQPLLFLDRALSPTLLMNAYSCINLFFCVYVSQGICGMGVTVCASAQRCISSLQIYMI